MIQFQNSERQVESFTIGMPPSINNYYEANYRRPGTHLKKAAADYRKDGVIELLKKIESGLITKMGDKRILLEVKLHFKDARIADIGNRDKGLEDLITHANIWDDDSQVDKLIYERGDNADPPYVEVRLTEILPTDGIARITKTCKIKKQRSKGELNVK